MTVTCTLNESATTLNSLEQPVGLPVNDWKGCALPSRETMSGRYCELVALDPSEHGSDLFTAFSKDQEGRNWTYLPAGPFEQAEDFDTWLRAQCSAEDLLFFAIVDKRSARAVGMASFMRMDLAQGVLEVGNIHFSPALQRTPLASEAMFLMMCRVFDELGYRRYEWKCDNCNEASKKAARRLGFTFEGIFRQARVYKGRNRDTAWFSMLDSEWPAIKQAFQTWLEPANFDETLQQIRRLEDCFVGGSKRRRYGVPSLHIGSL